jgi:hypothetical protein
MLMIRYIFKQRLLYLKCFLYHLPNRFQSMSLMPKLNFKILNFSVLCSCCNIKILMIIMWILNTTQTQRHLINCTILCKVLIMMLTYHLFYFCLLKCLMKSRYLMILTSWQGHMLYLTWLTKQSSLTRQTLK